MREQITLDEAEGRVFSGCLYSNDCAYVALLFGEDAFTLLKSRRDWSDGAELGESPLTNMGLLYEFRRESIIEAGLMSEERVKELEEQQLQSVEAIQDSRDRREFERLSKKYGASK